MSYLEGLENTCLVFHVYIYIPVSYFYPIVHALLPPPPQTKAPGSVLIWVWVYVNGTKGIFFFFSLVHR